MNHAIDVVNASFSYDEEREVLGNVSLKFESGQLIGIIGPNGSGKTTLIKLMSGWIRPKPNIVLLDGKDVLKFPGRTLAKHIAVVPQSTHIEFDFTVLDVVLMGRQPYISRLGNESEMDIQLARQAMAAVGVDHLEGRAVTALSGGELQRVIIARALAQDTSAILLDEPVANLDIHHQLKVLSMISDRAKNNGILAICVLHDLNLAANYCDKLVLLHDGNVLASGEPQKVLTPQNIKIAYDIEADVMANRQGKLQITPNYT